jgi:hypothetical protein
LNVEFGLVVSVRPLEAPAATLTDVAEAASVKVGAGDTVIESTFCCFTDPLVAEIVAE